MRTYSTLDRLFIEVDRAMCTVFGNPPTVQRSSPAADIDLNEDALPPAARRVSARLLRVDHAGEVSAQGLYQGQALTARNPRVREQMQHSAREENDHLAWCDGRIRELGGRRSRLNPLWYLGSYTLGAVAGLAGDRWSLGFVSETERQVVRHLDEHLQRVPAGDKKSQAILEQMKIDEAHHAHAALSAGGEELPAPVQRLMTMMSKVMTRTAYWV